MYDFQPLFPEWDDLDDAGEPEPGPLFPEWAGHIVNDRQTNALLTGHDPEPLDIRYADVVTSAINAEDMPASMSEEVGRWVERFRTDPEARLRAELADAAGIGYTAALDRWGTIEDLAAVIGYRAWRADDQINRCGRCGTHPDEWTFLDQNTGERRPLMAPKWKVYLWDCMGCHKVADADESLDEEQRRHGMRHILLPRADGEPEYDTF